MNRIIPLIMVAILGLGDIAFANMRGPYMRDYDGSEELRTAIPNVTVMKEDLLFQCDPPYRGSLDNVVRQRKAVRTSATYVVRSGQETEASFDFILNVNQPVTATINGLACQVGDPEMIHEHQERNHFGGDTDDSRYKVSFTGRLKPGSNTINVGYSQPMGVLEKMGGIYPIYISSKFTSIFSYDLSPLREWNLDGEFSLNIRIIIPDDTGWLKHLLGSDYRIHLYGVTRKEYETTDYRGDTGKHIMKDRTEIPGRTNRNSPSDINDISIEFGKDFPEMLEVRCEY